MPNFLKSKREVKEQCDVKKHVVASSPTRFELTSDALLLYENVGWKSDIISAGHHHRSECSIMMVDQ